MEQITTTCFECDNETKHNVLFNQETISRESEKMLYMVCECAGCSIAQFVLRIYRKGKKKDDYYELTYPEYGDSNSHKFLSINDHKLLPKIIKKLYDEVENSFLSKNTILSGIGLRTLVEAICRDQNIPGRNLKIMIDNLHKKGLISQSELPILDKLREIGNQSAHSIKHFPIVKLFYALEIINHVLKSIYVLPKINKSLSLS